MSDRAPGGRHIVVDVKVRVGRDVDFAGNHAILGDHCQSLIDGNVQENSFVLTSIIIIALEWSSM